MKQRTKESKKRLNSLILLVAFSAILLIASTYAWFAAQRDVTIYNIEGKVEVSEGLEISLNALNWSQELDLAELDWTGDDAASDSNNINPTELLPASTVGTVGGETMALYRGTATGTTLTGIDEITEDAGAGFFAFDVFLRNSTKGDAADKIHLTSTSIATVLQSGNQFSREASDTWGLQNGVRVGIATYTGKADMNDTQANIISATAKTTKVEKVAIWEPNANFHVDYIISDYASKLTLPADAGTLTARNSQIKTYALKDDVTSVDDVFDYTDSDSFAIQNTLQTTIDVPETGMPTSYAILEDPDDGETDLVLASDGSTVLTLEANKITRARIYVWLEGQDIDCINYASHGGGIEVILGLEKPAVE